MLMGKKKSSSKKASAGCRRHRQPAGGVGVCPSCLRERLSRLSPSASLPSVVVVRDEYSASVSSSCSECYSESESSSSGTASPGFHFRPCELTGRPSLLMRRERVVAVDGDEVAGIIVAGRRRRRTGFWTKLLRAATGGSGSSGRKKERADHGCSMAMARSAKTVEAAETTRWIVF